MIGVLILVIALFGPTHGQNTPLSPCPSVFTYETTGNEPGRWYGAVNIVTDTTLHSLWLNIILDSKADILGNWIGEVTTTDNTDFKIQNTKIKIRPGAPESVRFFVQYNPLNTPPRLQTVILNGREICDTNSPQPLIELDYTNKPERTTIKAKTVERPIEKSVEKPRETRPVNKEISIKPDWGNTRPIYGKPAGEGPVYVPPPSPSTEQINASPFKIGGGKVPGQSVTEQRPYQVTPTPKRSAANNNRRPVNIPDYFGGVLKLEDNPDQNFEQCGQVIRANPLVVNGQPTTEGQWPWQIALYQTQLSVDSKYICGGTLVSRWHIITAAHCVTLKSSRQAVDARTLTVFLGKHNLRITVSGTQVKFISEIKVNPQYNPSTFDHDAAIITMQDPVVYSELIRPACLWPEDQIDLTNVIGKKGSVVGWGFDYTGVATEELTLVEMPVVSTETCIRSFSTFFSKYTSDFTYCAGYRDGTSVCNGDSGGGMVFKMGDTWYLRGLVSLSVVRANEYRCDPTHFVIFTDLAKLMPWIKQNVGNK